MAKRRDDDSSGDIENNFGALVGELKKLRKELARVKKSKWRDRVVAGLFAIFAVVIMYINHSNGQDNKSTLNAVKAQGLAGVVSNCAFINIQSGAINEMITDFERSGLVLSNQNKEFFDKQRNRFQRIDCVALVSNSGEELSICLQYPDQTDPDTGLPIPTTTTPEDKEACEKASETARKAAEEQEKRIKEKRKSG